MSVALVCGIGAIAYIGYSLFSSDDKRYLLKNRAFTAANYFDNDLAKATFVKSGIRYFNTTNQAAIWKNLRAHYAVQDKKDSNFARLGMDKNGAATPIEKTGEAWALRHNNLFILAPVCLAFNTSDPRFLRATSDPSQFASSSGLYAVLAQPGEGQEIAVMATSPQPGEVGDRGNEEPIEFSQKPNL